MNKVLFILYFFFAHSVLAQPILNQSFLVPVIGDSYVLYDTDTSIQAGSGGANVTWTFNNLSFAFSQTTNYIDVASSPYPNAFPTASYVEKISSQYSYYSIASSNLLNLGYISGGDTLRWTPPMSVLCYPLTYLTVCPTSFYTGNYMGDSISGFFNVTCDGYGTLIINGQIFTNCLRLKGERHETVFSTLIGQYNIDQEVYYWLDGTHKFPLLNIATANSSGIVSVSIKKVLASSFVTLINDVENKLQEVKLFPNPAHASTILTLSHFKGVDFLIRVFDQKGSEIIKKVIPNNFNLPELKLDLSGIDPGFYFVEISSKESFTIKKLIVY